jgi:hypothetical protein
MGIWDRFGRGPDTQASTAAQPLSDEQAIARYRYMLRTAPPEAIEQAHAEAFARLTPEQRRMVLEELKGEIHDVDQVAAARAGDNPEALARLATRAEIRQPGTMERIFGGMGRAPAWSSAGAGLGGGGLGSVMAGSFFASMAGTVLGSLVAQQFFGSHPEAHRLFGAGGDSPFDHSDKSLADDLDKRVQEIYGDRSGASSADDMIVDPLDDGGAGFDGGDLFDA